MRYLSESGESSSDPDSFGARQDVSHYCRIYAAPLKVGSVRCLDAVTRLERDTCYFFSYMVPLAVAFQPDSVGCAHRRDSFSLTSQVQDELDLNYDWS